MYPRTGERIKAKIKSTGKVIEGTVVGKAFRARTGAVLHPVLTDDGKVKCIPWTSNRSIVEIDRL